MDHFKSMFIDNELSIDEKILFVNKIHNDSNYYGDTVSLIEQEKDLKELLCKSAPSATQIVERKVLPFRQIGLGVAALLLLAFSFLIGKDFSQFGVSQDMLTVEHNQSAYHRFVFFQEGSGHVEIAGSFTDWKKIPLVPTGSDGYWEVTLQLPIGEHRYSFIVDGHKHLPDPTVLAQESDDFGSVNSILHIEQGNGTS